MQSLVYNYTQTNVESHLAQSGSLLHRIRNVIHLRKLHPTFGLGAIRVLATDHESVLAHTSEYKGSGTNFGDQPETVLCVFSFSHNPIALRIDDADLAGTRLYDIFGGAVFPSFDDAGVLTLTLGAQSFYWLHCG